MEDSLVLPARMLLNVPILERKDTNIQSVLDEMTKILEYFGKKWEQQKEDSSNRISYLEACLTTTLDEFE